MGLVNYIKETKAELKHVSWPTRRQAAAFTAIVIVASVLLALYLGLFDYIFSEGLKYFIAHF
jgi:preprotein translocase subunit SecE